jgi:hypothetical protein
VWFELPEWILTAVCEFWHETISRTISAKYFIKV